MTVDHSYSVGKKSDSGPPSASLTLGLRIGFVGFGSHHERIYNGENTKVSNSLCGPYKPLSTFHNRPRERHNDE